MKKIYFCLAALAAMSFSSLSAQTVGFGVTAGMNVTKASGDGGKTEWKADNETGWYAGIQAKISLPILGLGIDGALVYSKETVSFEGKNSDDLNSLCVPLHLRFDLQLPGLTPFAFAGPQFSYNLNDFDFDDFSSKINAIETKDFTTKFDLGFGVVLGSQLQVAYSYSIPMTESFELNYDTYGHIADNYSLGTHHIGVTYFFK